jgi:hypothetical protein
LIAMCATFACHNQPTTAKNCNKSTAYRGVI